MDRDRLRETVVLSWHDPDPVYKRRLRSAIAEGHPDTPEGLFCTGWLSQDPQESVRLYGRAVEAAPDFTEAWLYLENTLWQGLSRRDEARAVLQEAIEANGENSALRSRRGFRAASLHQYDVALADMTRAVEDDPENTSLRSALSDRLTAQERLAEAERVLRQGIALAPTDPRLLLELGWLYQEHYHDHDEAERLLRGAIEASGGRGYYLAQLGDLFADQRKDHDTAVDLFQQAFSRDQNPNWLLRIASVQKDHLRDPEAAKETLERAASLAPDHDGTAFIRLAEIAREGKEPESLDGAEEVLRRGRIHSAQDPSLWIELAEVVNEQDRAAEAEGVFREAATRFPASWWVHAKWGEFVAKERPEEACEIATDYLQRHPDNASLLTWTSSWLMSELEDHAGSLNHTVRGLRLLPDSYHHNMRLHTLSSEHLDDRETAIQVYEQLWDETGVEEYLLQSARYREEKLEDRDGAVAFLEEVYQAELEEHDRRLLGVLECLGDYRLADGKLGKKERATIATATYGEVAEHRPEDLDLRIKHLRVLETADEGARQDLLDRLQARFPDALDLLWTRFVYWGQRDVGRARELAPSLDRAGYYVPRLAFMTGDLVGLVAYCSTGDAACEGTVMRGARAAAAQIGIRRDQAASVAPGAESRIIAQRTSGLGIVSPSRRWSAKMNSGVVWIRDLETGRIVNYFVTDAQRMVSFSPNSEMLLMGSQYFWEIYDVRTGALRGAVPRLRSVIGGDTPIDEDDPCWSPDSLSIAQPAYLGPHSRHALWISDVETGRLDRIVRVPVAVRAGVTDLDWSPSGRWFALSQMTPTDHSVVVFDSGTGELVHDLGPQCEELCDLGLNAWGFAIRFSPDERFLAFGLGSKCDKQSGGAGAPEAGLFLLDLASKQIQPFQRLTGTEGSRALAFSPNGDLLAVQESLQGTGYQISIRRTADKKAVLQFERSGVATPAFTADGEGLYVGALYDLDGEGEARQEFPSPLAGPSYPRMADGKLSFVDLDNRRTATWDLVHGSLAPGGPLEGTSADGETTYSVDENGLLAFRNLYVQYGERAFFKPAGGATLLETDRTTGRVTRELPFLKGRDLWRLFVAPGGDRLLAVYAESVADEEKEAFVSSHRDLTLYYDLIDLDSGERLTTAEASLTGADEASEGMCLTYKKSRVRVWFPSGGAYFAVRHEWSRHQRPRRGGPIRLRSLSDGEEIGTIGIWSTPVDLAFADDGSQLALTVPTGRVRLYDLANPEEPEEIAEHVVDPSHDVGEIDQIDGMWFLAVGGRIEQWDLNKGERLAVFGRHLDDVWCFLHTSDPERLVSIDSHEIVLWDLESREKLASLLAFDDGGWISYTPAGLYNASATGDRDLYWGKDGLVTPFAMFEKSLRNPEAVFEVLARGRATGDPTGADVVREIVEHSPPRVRVLAPVDGATARGRTTTARIEVVPGSESIERIVVRESGKIVQEQSENLPEPGTGLRGPPDVRISLPLLRGENLFEVYAETATQRSAIEEFTIVRKDRPSRGQPGTPTGTLHLVAIGVSDHQATRYQLEYADDDATGLTAAMEAGAAQLYEDVRVSLLTNADADRRGILTLLDEVATRAYGEGDTLVVFIAGHGIHVRNRLFFLAHDSAVGEAAATAVHWRDVDEALRDARCPRILLLLDTCYAGDFFEGDDRGAAVSRSQDAFRDEITRGSGVKVIAATGGDEQARETDDLGHGAFTYALLEALEGKADGDGDGAVSVDEVYRYVQDRAHELSGGHQTPTTPHTARFRDFPLVRTTAN